MLSEALGKIFSRNPVVQRDARRTFEMRFALSDRLFVRVSFKPVSYDIEKKNWWFCRNNEIAWICDSSNNGRNTRKCRKEMTTFWKREGWSLPRFNIISRDDTWSICSAITSLVATHRTNIEAIRTDRSTTDIAKFVHHEYSILVNHRKVRRGRATIFVPNVHRIVDSSNWKRRASNAWRINFSYQFFDRFLSGFVTWYTFDIYLISIVRQKFQ